MTCYLAPISWGIGDLIVSLPAIDCIIESGEPCVLVARSQAQVEIAERIVGLAGCMLEKEFASIRTAASDRFVNLRDHPLQRDHWWGSEKFYREFPDHKINDLLSIITADIGLTPDFHRLKPLRFSQIPTLANTVIFVPGTDGSYKCWTAERWLGLQKHFTSNGRDVIMLGEPDKVPALRELLNLGVKWYPTKHLGAAVEAISSCRTVISVDTGLMHVGVQQGIPTVGLYRHNPIYVRPQAHHKALIAPPCDAECVRRSTECRTNDHLSFDGFTPAQWVCALPGDARCLTRVSCDQVVEAVDALGEVSHQESFA